MMKKILSRIWPISIISLLLSIVFWYANWYQRLSLDYPVSSDVINIEYSLKFIYWLLIWVNISAPILATFIFFVMISSISSWVAYKIQKIKPDTPLGKSIFILIAASFLAIFAAIPSIVIPWDHLTSLKAQGKTYYLTAIYTREEINYALMECDAVGLICQQVQRIGNIPEDTIVTKSRLIYDEKTYQLSIKTHEEGIIYTYQP
ncbi:MAG: hypothetical protein OEY93_02295 [Anaerolineae bacterium]|nr:hypothetical protein [Anaerolineae bacterium]